MKMEQKQRYTISSIFSVAIILAALYVAHRFILPLAWAGLITIVCWPLYKKIHSYCGGKDAISAFIITAFITIIIAIPISWLLTIVVQEAHMLALFLIKANEKGIAPPFWMQHLPLMKSYLQDSWNRFLGQPQGISQLLKLSQHAISPASHFIKIIGLQVVHRSVILGFTLLCLFFLFKDGPKINKQLHRIGEYCLGDRWHLYSKDFPQAIRAIVNGSVLVGFGVGIIMGIIYSITNVPAPAILGLFTAILAMIPFGAPIAFVIVTLILFIKESLISGIVILIIGTIVMLISDHFVRPNLIGSAIRLPFLAVLFGILGGVETMGLIGLFLGPAIMALFITLWREPMQNS